MSFPQRDKERSVAVTLALSACSVFLLLSLIRLLWPEFDGAASSVLRADGSRLFLLSESLGTLFDPIVLFSLTLAGIAVLLFLKKRRWALFFLCAMAGALGSGLLLKELFEIARPSLWGPHELGWSFPSLHATAVTVFLLSLLYAIEERIHAHALVIFWGMVMLAGIGMVGVSRVYLGVHMVSDVLAGFALGVFWVSLSAALSFHHFRPLRPASDSAL